MMNQVALMGRLCREPELRYTPSGKEVCTVTLAVERDVAPEGGKREADFIDVVCWNNVAAFVSKYMRKGLLVGVVGRIATRKWADKDGNNRVSVEVVAGNVYFAERADRAQAEKAEPLPNAYTSSGSYGTPSGGPAETARSARPAGNPPVRTPPISDFSELMDDDQVPF